MTSKFHLDANVEELMKDPSLGEDKLAAIVEKMEAMGERSRLP
jgi:hypothetical protein